MPSYNRRVSLPGKTAQELYDRVAADIDRFLSKASLPIKADVQRDPTKKEVTVESSMFSAVLACTDGALDLSVKLSFFAAPFKGKLDEGIDKWLAKTFQA